jgi:NAD(P)-dependent dehydrogenase (short-subunit alcohol dehydrogenase family)
MARLDGRRALVLGASKGIGCAIAKTLHAEGAQVAFAARSADRLAAEVAACGDGAVAVSCDVRDPAACESVVEETVAALGGLDILVYATGLATFVELAEADAAAWATVLETNVVGASLVTKAALPHLVAAGGHAVYLSSNSAAFNPPWRGLGLYITSKVALERLVRCWEEENRQVAFTSYVVGPTASEFGSEDPDGLARFVGEWFEKGYIGANVLAAETHGEAIVNLLTSPARIQTITVVPR